MKPTAGPSEARHGEPRDAQAFVIRPITRTLVELRRAKSSTWRLGDLLVLLFLAGLLSQTQLGSINIDLRDSWWLIPLLFLTALRQMETERRLKRLEGGLIEAIVELRKLPLNDNPIDQDP